MDVCVYKDGYVKLSGIASSMSSDIFEVNVSCNLHREKKGHNEELTDIRTIVEEECLGCGFISEVYKNNEKLWYL